MRYLVMVAVLALVGCADAEAVRLQHSDGRTAQCGPYRVPGLDSSMAATMQQQACVQDFKEQGFVRAAR